MADVMANVPGPVHPPAPPGDLPARAAKGGLPTGCLLAMGIVCGSCAVGFLPISIHDSLASSQQLGASLAAAAFLVGLPAAVSIRSFLALKQRKDRRLLEQQEALERGLVAGMLNAGRPLTALELSVAIARPVDTCAEALERLTKLGHIDMEIDPRGHLLYATPRQALSRRGAPSAEAQPAIRARVEVPGAQADALADEPTVDGPEAARRRAP